MEIVGHDKIDVGNPQLSMHSIREVGGTDDVKHGIDLLKVSNIGLAYRAKDWKIIVIIPIGLL